MRKDNFPCLSRMGTIVVYLFKTITMVNTTITVLAISFHNIFFKAVVMSAFGDGVFSTDRDAELGH